MIPRRLVAAFSVAALLVVVGTLGYRLIEGEAWSWFDALYMTAITLTTVGFLEVHELSPAGRMFTVGLCLGGVSLLAYSIGEVIRYVVTGELLRERGRGIMERMLAAMHDHVIVCGYGRVGRLVCEQLNRMNRRFVVIEQDLNNLESLKGTDVPWVHGDATSDGMLVRAGGERAFGLIAACASDADNLYITLSARLMNPQLHIVARCEDEACAQKFRKVGANHVVSPYVIGGLRMAQAVTRPNVAEFIDKFTVTGGAEFQIEEITLRPGSKLVGRSLAELRLAQELSLTLVAIRQGDGSYLSAPTGECVLLAGQTLIVVGDRKQLNELEQLAVG